MVSQELCGVITKSGKPCNMPKNHDANFHRFREYDEPIKWSITSSDGSSIEEGTGRVPLSYAIGRVLKNNIDVHIHLTRPR